MSRLSTARLYAIADLGYLAPEQLEAAVAALLAGGADILQLRAKDHEPAAIERFVRRILPLCRAAAVPLIVNDHPQIAAATGADGVHLGQDDGPPAAARELLGPAALIGRSTHSPAQAAAALAEGADYIGFGPLFATPTKPGRPPIGLADIAAVEAAVGARIPVFCIGGINPATLPAVLAAGARRVVIVSGLLEAPDVQHATRALRAAIADCGLRIEELAGCAPGGDGDCGLRIGIGD
jgi:thiamine-phosphate pyrophosphorylase